MSDQDTQKLLRNWKRYEQKVILLSIGEYSNYGVCGFVVGPENTKETFRNWYKEYQNHKEEYDKKEWQIMFPEAKHFADVYDRYWKPFHESHGKNFGEYLERFHGYTSVDFDEVHMGSNYDL